MTSLAPFYHFIISSRIEVVSHRDLVTGTFYGLHWSGIRGYLILLTDLFDTVWTADVW